MTPRLQKCILIILVALLIAPATLFSRPKKSDAFINCLIGQLFGTGATAAVSSAAGALSVPVHDMAHTQVSGQNLSQNTAQTTKECYMDFLVNVMAKTLIHNLTKSIVSWINNGFEGSPSFVTNPEGFFLDVGDQVVGQSIYNLGAIGQVLCSPFDLDLRLVLGLSFSTTREERIQCRLSDVQKNVQDAFIGGQFGGEAGWQNWFSIYSDQNNNAEGAFLNVTHEINAGIISATGIQSKKLDWGRGFLSMQDCEQYERRPDGSRGKCLKQGKIKTPGGIIETQLSNALGTDLRQLELADEINEIFGALVNAMINQIFSPTGLAGTSESPPGGGRSYLDSLASGNVEADYQRAFSVATASIPAGITTICSEFKQNIYESVANSSYQNAPYNGRIVRVKVRTGTAISGAAEFASAVPTTKTVNGQSVPWTIADFEDVRSYCSDNGINGSAQDVADRLIPRSTFATTTNLFGDAIPRNIAINKPARQSSTNRNPTNIPSTEAGSAVDGNTFGNDFSPLAITSAGGGQWWQVDLLEEQSIGTVKIWEPQNLERDIKNFRLIVSNRDLDFTYGPTITENMPGVTYISDIISSLSASTGGSRVMTFNVNKSGRFVRVQLLGDDFLQLAEVEVFPTTYGQNQNNFSGLPAVFSPPNKQGSIASNSTYFNEFSIISDKDTDGLKLSVDVNFTPRQTYYQRQSVMNPFNAFRVTLTDDSGSIIQTKNLVTTQNLGRSISVTPAQFPIQGTSDPFSITKGRNLKVVQEGMYIPARGVYSQSGEYVITTRLLRSSGAVIDTQTTKIPR